MVMMMLLMRVTMLMVSVMTDQAGCEDCDEYYDYDGGAGRQ